MNWLQITQLIISNYEKLKPIIADFLQIYKKKKDKKKMDVKLYYEAKGVTKVPEIESTYKYAVEHNVKFYRAVSNTGEYFGWLDGAHIKATKGQEWFINPHYVEPVAEEIAEQLLATESLDYKQLYEKEHKKMLKYKELYEKANDELMDIENAFATIGDLFEISTRKRGLSEDEENDTE